ncbi:MAG: hypothetical protein ACRYG2_34995 [Janthinobacterium lividum]
MKVLRALGLAWGLAAALGILVSRRAVTRYAAGLQAETLAPEAGPPTAEPAPAAAVRRARVVVGGIGLLVLLTGVWKVLHAVQPASYLWLVIWLGAAVVLHDGVLVPVLSLLRAGTYRGLPTLSEPAIALVRAGLLVGGLLVLVVVPEIWAQHLGPLNPTVLPGSYARRLLITLAVIAVLTAAAATVVACRSRFKNQRAHAALRAELVRRR